MEPIISRMVEIGTILMRGGRKKRVMNDEYGTSSPDPVLVRDKIIAAGFVSGFRFLCSFLVISSVKGELLTNGHFSHTSAYPLSLDWLKPMMIGNQQLKKGQGDFYRTIGLPNLQQLSNESLRFSTKASISIVSTYSYCFVLNY